MSASAQQNTAQWDKFVDFNNRFLNGFPKLANISSNDLPFMFFGLRSENVKVIQDFFE